VSVTHDPEAERALIGACLLSGDAIDTAIGIVEPADFHTPRHQAIYDAILTAHRAGEPIDIIGLARNIKSADVSLEYLHELLNDTYSVGQARKYATMVAAARVHYRLVMAAGQIAQLGNGEAGALDAGDAAARARQIVADIDMPTVRGAPSPTVGEWLRGIDTSYDWLFPDFLEAGDRMLVTAAEGMGKSTLLRQIAFQAAAGIHPWNHRRCPPIDTLMVDLENGQKMLGRKFTQLARNAPDVVDNGRLRFEGRPRGIDITTATDRRWLMDRIAVARPRLLVIGPAYKLTRGEAGRNDIGGEERAKLTVDLLDDIRERFGIALIMETHSPHGHAGGRDLRPFGSSVWLRWPEFGVGFAESKSEPHTWDLIHWRGPRDERIWPRAMQRGGRWPWTAVGMPDGTYGPQDELPPIDLYDDDHTLGGPA
jgi:hypothetical protein